MNEYYPFIVRELSKLDRNTGESRREMYARAREQLVSELHRPAHRVSESEIAAERGAFDAAARRIESELAHDQKLDSAPIAPRTPLDFLASVPITEIRADALQINRIGEGFLQINRTEREAAQDSCEGEYKSASRAATSSGDLDLLRQRTAMLRAIGTPRALELAAHHEQSTKAIEKEQTKTQMTQTNDPDRIRRDSARLGETTHAPLMEIMPRDIDLFELKTSRTGFVPRAIQIMRKLSIHAIVGRSRTSANSTETTPVRRPPIAVDDIARTINIEEIFLDEMPPHPIMTRATNPSTLEKTRTLDLAVHPKELHHAIETRRMKSQLSEANSFDPIPDDNSAMLGGTTFSVTQVPIEEVTPKDAVVDFSLKTTRRPGLTPPRTHRVVAVIQVIRKQLLSMMRAIVVFCLVFVVIYFIANIEKWFGF